MSPAGYNHLGTRQYRVRGVGKTQLRDVRYSLKQLKVVLVCICLCSYGCERKLPVRDSDKSLFLRAGDLVPYGFEFRDIEKFEKFTRAKVIDGYDVEYEFQTPDSERRNPLFLYGMVTVVRKKSDAKLSDTGIKIGMLYGLKTNGIKEQEIPNFYRYGDASSFSILKKDGKPVGNYFTVREGNKLFVLLITGLYFEDPELWKEIIEPKLKLFSAYSPA